jgi:ABC-type glycerol-3-phosphate transport system substrate-binding protein
MNRRRFMQSTLLATAGGLLSGCVAAPGAAPGGASGSAAPATGTAWLTAEDISAMPDTTMRYWFYETPERTELGKKQVVEFHEMFPNLTVDGRVAPPNTDNEMLVAFIKAGTNSHVHQSVCLEDTWYITRDLLLPLQDLPGFQDVWDRMNPNLNYTWKDGNVYSFSWYSGPRLWFYNKKMVEAAGLDSANPPKTYSEFLTWAKALTTGEQFFSALSSAEEWWRWQFIVYPFYIAATGTNQLHSDDGTQAVFNRPEAVQVYELFATLFKEGYNIKEAVEGNPFFSGQVAAALDGAAIISNAKRYAPPDFEMVVGPVPKPDDSTVAGAHTYNFVRNLALMREQSAQGEEADRINRAAWEFMKYLLSPEQLAADFAAQGDLPPVNDLLENEIYRPTLDQLGPVATEYAKYSADSYIYDMHTHLESESQAVLQKSYLNLIFDKQGAAEALADAEAQVNEILAKG